MSSTPRSTLITGAGGGLGSAIARRFAATGQPVVCLDRDEAAARRTAAALFNLTRALVLEFWGTGVTANAVCPGAMDTPMLDRSAAAAFLRKTPTRRVVNPDEVAALCAYLISEDAAGINGQSIVIDGGATSVFRYTDEEPL